jgi:nitroreductase
MDFFELIRSRHSVRSFKKQAVEEEKIKKILDAANSAPSAGNLQSYEIYVVRSQDMKSNISKVALDQPSIREADVLLVFCANMKKAIAKYGGRGTELYCIQDATIACAYAQLAAADLGLGSVWVGHFMKWKLQI